MAVPRQADVGRARRPGRPPDRARSRRAAVSPRQRQRLDRARLTARPCARRRPARRRAPRPRRPPSGGVGGVEQARTNAEPTMTPSAKAATSAAWAPLDTPSPTQTGRSVTARTRRDQRAGRARRRRAGAGDAHRRGGVDEAAAVLGGVAQPLVGRGRRDEEDPVQPGGVGGGEPVRRARRLVGREVGRDDAGAAGGGQRVGEPLVAVALDRVPVGHHQRRARRSRRPLATVPSTSSVVVPLRSAASTAAWMVGPSISGSE